MLTKHFVKSRYWEWHHKYTKSIHNVTITQIKIHYQIVLWLIWSHNAVRRRWFGRQKILPKNASARTETKYKLRWPMSAPPKSSSSSGQTVRREIEHVSLLNSRNQVLLLTLPFASAENAHTDSAIRVSLFHHLVPNHLSPGGAARWPTVVYYFLRLVLCQLCRLSDKNRQRFSD